MLAGDLLVDRTLQSLIIEMEPITYSLNENGSASDTYYSDIAQFTDDVLAHAKGILIPYAREFRNYIVTYELEEPRTIEECTFELLNLGILWRTYGRTALSVRFAPYRLLATLAERRKKHQQLKPSIDVLRGVLITIFLLPGGKRGSSDILPGLSELERLIFWLEATGEFHEDAIRLIRWHAFWCTLSVQLSREMTKAAVEFSRWFEDASRERMGKYTPRVESFLSREATTYRWREDRISCTRSRPEYHLNMLGAEIMNRAFRNDFLETDRKALLVPGCIRALPEDQCEAKRVPEGLICSFCTPQCHTNQLRGMGEKRGFEVFIVPHASDVTIWISKPGMQTRGVVGVACLTTLVSGGWELKHYGVPAQCVLLNYCGCKKHWHKEGIATEIDLREMKRVFVAA